MCPVGIWALVPSEKLSPDADKAKKYDSAKYKQYITQDFESHWVFVDIEVFMKNVLHIPDNWKELWGPTINRIKSRPDFLMAHLDYSRQCDTESLKETLGTRAQIPTGHIVNTLRAQATCDSNMPSD